LRFGVALGVALGIRRIVTYIKVLYKGAYIKVLGYGVGVVPVYRYRGI